LSSGFRAGAPVHEWNVPAPAKLLIHQRQNHAGGAWSGTSLDLKHCSPQGQEVIGGDLGPTFKYLEDPGWSSGADRSGHAAAFLARSELGR
jgi:hypothetical protein